MAGQIVVDTIKASSGVLATQNGMTGIAKAWITYSGGTQTIFSSFNVSSVTYNSAGSYAINFTTAMPNANYAVFGTSQAASGNVISCYVNNGAAKTTSSVGVLQYYGTGPTAFDSTTYVAIFSS